ncbi:hypothetical protein [Acidisphaera sp. S103]|uniref:hypothetical protein n=1 Tax=Acidisphaera sp. S103 TaxID=1747223 RepID=UPI00131E467B|nr:hypothetical protein [Acidisphaera sp. S103]
MANNSAPRANPAPNSFPAWRLRNGTTNATDDAIENASSSCERWEWWCAVVVVVSVAAEFALASVHPSYDSLWNRWGSAAADALIAIGIVGEVLFGRMDGRYQTELRRRSTVKLAEAVQVAAAAEVRAAEANARSAEVDLKRTELEARLQPRMTDQRQFDLIQELRGKLPEISIIHNATAEPRWFANSLRDAFFIAGIRVGVYRLASDNPTEGVFIYSTGSQGAHLSDVGNALVDLFRGTQTPVAILTGMPVGVSNVPLEYPAIIIGERFSVLPPHIAKAMQMADAAHAEMKRQGLP